MIFGQLLDFENVSQVMTVKLPFLKSLVVHIADPVTSRFLQAQLWL